MFAGRLYDGKSADRKVVEVSVDAEGLLIRGPDIEPLRWNRTDVRLRSPVGSGPWVVESGEGARLEVAEGFAQAISAWSGDDINRSVRALESKWPWVIVALAVGVGVLLAMLRWGVPAVARGVAASVPAQTEQRVGQQVIRLLDRSLMEPSLLPDPTRARVERLFAAIEVESGYDGGITLQFRSSERVGANAFALPGGTIVLTDEIIELAESDDEIAAVLAHEIGHVVGRHSLRLVLQNSLGTLLLASVTGDIASTTALGAGIPAVLMQLGYSREMEREADAYAFGVLRDRGYDTGALRSLLSRIQDQYGTEEVPDFLSSHPRTESRDETSTR